MASVNRRTFLGGLAASAAAPLLRAQQSRGTDRLLDEIERRACAYFYEQADPETGFGLSAMCIADQRGYLDTPVARDRVARTLRFLIEGAAHEHGFFYHFLNSRTGERVWNCEVSSVDTTWLMCGVL